jgi:prepilin signal peptidase PulO-like enzyme (type II secretory pathway)
MGFVGGRSFCPWCKSKIAWYDNLPLLSYLFLSGRCRKCGKKISLRYPLIEISSAFVFFLSYLAFFRQSGIFENGLIYKSADSANYLAFFALLVFLSSLICIFVVDFENKLIPDSLVFFSLLSAFCFLSLSNSLIFYRNIFSGFSASLFLLFLFFITKGRGMGLGDVKFALVGGFVLSLAVSLDFLFLAFLTGAVVGIILIMAGRAKLRQKIAFGPFLVFSLFIEMFFGPILLKWFGII